MCYFVAATCPRCSNRPPNSKLHLSTRGSLTRTRQGTVTRATWTSTAARRSAERSTNRVITSSACTVRSAPTSGSTSGTTSALRALSLGGSKLVFQYFAILLIYASLIFT